MVQLIHGLFPRLEVRLRQAGQGLAVGGEPSDGRDIVVFEDWDWEKAVGSIGLGLGLGGGLVSLVEVQGWGGRGGKHFVRNKKSEVRVLCMEGEK
jgi:hypothetical protein